MRDLFAMLFAANLMMVLFNIHTGNYVALAANAIGGICSFASWLPYCLSDKRVNK